MGFPPPPDIPSPPEPPDPPQIPVIPPIPLGIPGLPSIPHGMLKLGSSFSGGLPASPTICGFGIPGFNFLANLDLSLLIPEFDFPPLWFFALSISCDLAHPLTADIGPAGGRKPKLPDNPFDRDD